MFIGCNHSQMDVSYVSHTQMFSLDLDPGMLSLMAGAVRVGLIALRAKLIRDPEKKSAMHTKARNPA